MAGLTDGRFSNMLQRGSSLAAPAIAPRNRYAGSIAEESSSVSGGNFIAVNEHGRMTVEPRIAPSGLERPSLLQSTSGAVQLADRRVNDLQVINQSDEVGEVFQDNISPDRLISVSP